MTNAMGNDGHRERLRKKFLNHGLDKFTDEEIIELLLTLATPRKDCKQAAREALKQFKSFRSVLEADTNELVKIKGIGPNNAFGIKFIHQITRKFLREKMLSRPCLQSTDEVMDYLNHSMRSLSYEAFRVIYINAENEIIDEEEIAAGTATLVPVTPAQIVVRALKNGAVNIVMAHNHPGGSATPSEEDRSITKETLFTCRMVNLELREHLIIAPHGHFSFSSEGVLAEYSREFDSFYKKRF